MQTSQGVVAQEFGILELYRPANSVPEVDVVAVHGLNSDRFNTWSTATDSPRICWLSHPSLLPRYLPNARVLTWGYNANVASFGTKAVSSERLLQHAQTLVAQLWADRDLDDACERPIIFLCHSLGGIVVKKAIAYAASRTSSQVAHLQSIFTCTSGLLFFGTPHHGTSKARVAHTLTRVAKLALLSKAISLSTTLLRTLESESEALQEVTAAFTPLMQRFRIFFFWEQHKTDQKYTREYVVEEHSAAPIVDGTERCGIAADHREMCRFSRSDDTGFRTVVSSLKRYARDAPDTIKERCRRADGLLEDERSWQAMNLIKTLPRKSPTSATTKNETAVLMDELVLKPAWQS